MRTSRKALNPPPGSWRSGKVGRGRAPGFRRRLDPSPGGGHRGHVEGGGGGNEEEEKGSPRLAAAAPFPLAPERKGAEGWAADPTYLSPGQ